MRRSLPRSFQTASKSYVYCPRNSVSRPGQPGLVTVPHPKAEIPLPTLRSIYRQASWPWK
ncbi:type II toxin-antitoxin system HicA family toxin [Thiorhodococcus mannitoliphagus]|uniref:type II toxin-antitoxin system HicA family toxin n=1 Tax=Thiorhodococcus mannitoliphagus TaxID=329406 RepID=UPI003B8372C4